MASTSLTSKTPAQLMTGYLLMLVGAFIAAFAIQVFLLPSKLIDGGVIGISLILARLTGQGYLPIYIIALNLPFVYLAYRFIRKSFVIQMTIAVLMFAAFLVILKHMPPFEADILEVIVVGGALLGTGAGLIIRAGGCTDGTEILGIIINRKKGFTVGQVILFINLFVFIAYGMIFQDWHIALRSLMTYVVAFKMIDLVISGLDELKWVMIISQKPDQVSQMITEQLGLGLTVLYGRGGFSRENRELLLVVVERLDIADLKEIVLQEDPSALISIQDLNEFVSGRSIRKSGNTKRQGKSRKKTNSSPNFLT